jgi:hypothetical protein
MNFTEDYCNTLIESFNNDENTGGDMFQQLLNSYLNKYDNKIKRIYEIQVEFRNDTKLLFNVIINTLANKEKMMEAFDDDFDENNETDVKEKQDYITFCDNVNCVLEQIDTVDLLHPDDKFSTNCSNAISYLNERHNSMNQLNETLGRLSSTLNKVAEVLAPLVPTSVMQWANNLHDDEHMSLDE